MISVDNVWFSYRLLVIPWFVKPVIAKSISESPSVLPKANEPDFNKPNWADISVKFGFKVPFSCSYTWTFNWELESALVLPMWTTSFKPSLLISINSTFDWNNPEALKTSLNIWLLFSLVLYSLNDPWLLLLSQVFIKISWISSVLKS